MSLEETVVDKLRALPVEKQLEVLDFVEFLRQKALVKRPLRSVEGLWADLGPAPTAEEIDEARREMWHNFPREFPKEDP